MFCPNCSAENELTQGYCRQCGQSLMGARLALDGSVGKSLEKLKRAEERIQGGISIVFVFTLISMALAAMGLLFNEQTLIVVGFLTVLLGSIIGTPLIFVGKASLKRATRLLSKAQIETGRSALNATQPDDNLLTPELHASPSRLVAQRSVTEHTTLDLRKTERK